MHVIDLQGNEYPLQATSTNDNEVNGNQSFSATIYPSKVNKVFISDIQELWTIVDHDDVEHKIIYCKRQGQGEVMTAEVKAIPLFFDVLDNDRIYERIDKHMTAQEACTHIFKDTGFDFVLVDSFAAIQWEGFGEGETKLETFSRAKERYKWEFEIVGNIVYLKKQIGRDTSIQYRHKLNASNIVQEIDAKEMWTYAKGYGNYGDGEGGEDWQNAKLTREYTSPLANILGIRHAPPIKNGNITDTATMDKQLKTLVDESLKISVSADIYDLRKQGYPIAQSQVGDRVFLIDERIGLDDEVRVVAQSITRDWKGNVLDISLTFGSEGLAKRHQSNINTAVKDITALLEGKKQLPFSAFDIAMQNATKALQSITSELTIPSNGGLMAIDKNDPNNVVLYNAAGIGVSDNGGATFKNSITGQGVVAETIVGQSIIGVNLSSVDEKGYFHVNGSDAEFYNSTTNERVTIDPNGLYGYKADGSYRFRADDLLVTSRAIGTTTANVYIAPDSNNEARVVDIKDVPSDGEISSYSYRPLRADGFYGNFIENNAGSYGNNLYLRPRSGGEVRITGAGTTDAYYPLRAGKVYSNGFITTTLSLFMGTDSAMHIVNKSYAVDGVGPPIYRDLYAASIKGTSFITSTENAYIGADGVLKVVNKGLTDIFRPVWAASFENKSLRELKKDITLFEDDALSQIKAVYPYLYRMNTDEPDSKMQLGLMANDVPDVLNGSDGTTVSLYPLSVYMWKGIQQIIKRVEALEGSTNAGAS